MRILVLLMMVATFGLAAAQLYPSKLGLLAETAFRLGEDRVQFELGFADTQKKSIQAILGEHGKEQAKLSKSLGAAKPESYDDIQVKIERLELASSQKMLRILSPGQRERLWQIAVQNAGPFALRNGEVASKIGLTADQKSRLAELAAKVTLASEDVNAQMSLEIAKATSEKKRTQIVKSFEPKLAALNRKGELQVLGLLSKNQLVKWKQLKGKPFRL